MIIISTFILPLLVIGFPENNYHHNVIILQTINYIIIVDTLPTPINDDHGVFQCKHNRFHVYRR